jgi:hypothetical protein
MEFYGALKEQRIKQLELNKNRRYTIKRPCRNLAGKLNIRKESG